MKDGQLAAIKKRYKKLNKMKQAKVSFQLKKTGMQLDEDQNGEKRSVSNQFLVGSDDRPSVSQGRPRSSSRRPQNGHSPS